ncbi:MAG: hypothetical protein V4538_08070 [Bacteroidota bacterium]
MIKSTAELIEYLKVDKDKRETSLVQSYVEAIFKLGSKEDASLLLDSYLKQHFDFAHSYLLILFRKFGDKTFADKIFNIVIADEKLNENADPDILTLLAELNYEPIKKILFNYAFSNIESDYQFQKASILGLLNYDCNEYKDTIKANIENCLNKNLFPEFIPALVCKLSDKKQMLEKLYESGDKIASTDCNAGIILGFSLCGEEGKKYFKKALFNPNWETYSGSTGTVRFTYEGLKNLNIKFSELYNEIKQLKEKREISYALQVLFSLFDCRISDYENDDFENFKTLYKTFFSWENPDSSNNLIDMARLIEMESKAYEYQKIFELKMTEEIIIENYSS